MHNTHVLEMIFIDFTWYLWIYHTASEYLCALGLYIHKCAYEHI